MSSPSPETFASYHVTLVLTVAYLTIQEVQVCPKSLYFFWHCSSGVRRLVFLDFSICPPRTTHMLFPSSFLVIFFSICVLLQFKMFIWSWLSATVLDFEKLWWEAKSRLLIFTTRKYFAVKSDPILHRLMLCVIAWPRSLLDVTKNSVSNCFESYALDSCSLKNFGSEVRSARAMLKNHSSFFWWWTLRQAYYY